MDSGPVKVGTPTVWLSDYFRFHRTDNKFGSVYIRGITHMKKSALTIAISSLLLASGAHAATVYNQNDTKLEIGGRAQGAYYGTDDNGSEGD